MIHRTYRFAAPFLAVLGVLLAAAPARAWWNSDWTLRRKIVVDSAPAGGANGGVLLLRLHDGDFQFPAAQSDGSDLRFVAEDDRTALPFQIERFDSLLDTAFVWVKLPAPTAGTKTTLWLYYGNSHPNLPKGDSAGVFGPDATLVYHFYEHGQPPNDASGNGLNATTAAAPADGALIGTGLRLDGHHPVQIPAAPAFGWTEGGPLTWSAWVNPAAAANDAAIFNRDDQGHGFQIGIDHGIPYVEVSDQAGVHRSSAGPAIVPAHWHHLAVVSDGSQLALYVDGEPYSTLASRLPGLASGATLGAGDFAGDLDELEIYHAAKPAAAIKFAALEQGGSESTAKLLDLGADEQATNWLSWLSTGYVGIILKSLTVDGWVVIGLLGVMAMISWAVMVTKASYLNATAKGNTLFLTHWRQLTADLTALDWKDDERVRTLGGHVRPADEKVMRDAAVYRIYHIGAEEIRHRLRRGDGLSARSMEAIRASLDAGLVRETQRLNRFLVLLTIAISGGPFLGLLGTVVGVMITFAAIAAAGDVNVNSIAPGIAAALAATVAGLLVAIPSLFGYNYLLGRVKNATSDMAVFIDEFVARMAEFHGEGEE